MTQKTNFLFKIRSKAKLCKYLGISRKDLNLLRLDDNYIIYEEPKHNGIGVRTIEAPCKKLKIVQKKINKALQKTTVPAYLCSGIKGKSFIDNALAHVQNRFILCLDIDSFYPSTSKENVFQYYKYSLCTPDDIAWTLTDLTTINGHLPTGAPTSVILAYLAYQKTFDEIYLKAKELNIEMTVYVDDITFSSKKDIPIAFYNFVEKRMKEQKLSIKKKKTKWYNPNDFKIITGNCISAEGKTKVPLKNIFKIKAIMSGKNIKNLSKKELISLRGCLYAANRIEEGFWKNLFTRVIKLLNEK